MFRDEDDLKEPENLELEDDFEDDIEPEPEPSRFIGLDLSDPTRKWSLNDLCEVLEHIAEARLPMPEQKTLDFLKDKIAAKPDACRYQMDKWKDEAKQCAKYAQQFYKRARALKAKRERLSDYIVYTMQRHGWDALQGARFQISIAAKDSVSVDLRADAMTYRKFEGFMRRSYSWDMSGIKKALKTNPDAISALANNLKIEQKFHAKFTLKKASK